jgi:hypothetical protein
MYQTLLYQKEGPISVVQLNRPQKKTRSTPGDNTGQLFGL